jgi:hypothetical protein
VVYVSSSTDSPTECEQIYVSNWLAELIPSQDCIPKAISEAKWCLRQPSEAPMTRFSTKRRPVTTMTLGQQLAAEKEK